MLNTDHLGRQHELLYATSSTKPVTSFLPLESLIHTCSIISSEKFASLYPAFHPSWSTRWKITTDALSDHGESDEDDGGDEDELLLNLSSEQQLDRQVQATKIPPAVSLATSTSGFNAHKRAVPLVYFCRRAFDKFGKGGEGKSWWYINWESLFARGVEEGNWSVTDDVKIHPKKTSAPKTMTAKPTTTRSKRSAASTRGARPEVEEPEEEASGDETASDLEDVESVASEEIDDAANSDEDQDASEQELPSTPSKKRKRAASTKTKETPRKRRKNARSEGVTPRRGRKRNTETATAPRTKKKDRTRSTAIQTITQEIDPLLLPTDPYERALHLLHVGATPDSLPCREDEFLEVLMKVEEGIEDGGGGCLCERTVDCAQPLADVRPSYQTLPAYQEPGKRLQFTLW